MRRYFILASASIGLLMYAIDTTVVAVAFPSLTGSGHDGLVGRMDYFNLLHRGHHGHASGGKSE
jgi:hypothetical protein